MIEVRFKPMLHDKSKKSFTCESQRIFASRFCVEANASSPFCMPDNPLCFYTYVTQKARLTANLRVSVAINSEKLHKVI